MIKVFTAFNLSPPCAASAAFDSSTAALVDELRPGPLGLTFAVACAKIPAEMPIMSTVKRQIFIIILSISYP
jgi:hypothetical protein